MKMTCTNFILTSIFLCYQLSASVVDQSQLNCSGYEDWGHGSGQTFVAEKDGLLTGVEFFIDDFTNPGSSEVYLWRTDESGKPIEPKLATGYIDKSTLTNTVPAWYSIEFDTPYAQSSGERLAFSIFLLTFGSEGWNNYGLINYNSYTNGCRIYWSSGNFSSSPDSDWTFKSMVIPTPDIYINTGTSNIFGIHTTSSEDDATYVVQSCTNLTQPDWCDVATNAGSGQPLSWDFPTDQIQQGYFKLLINKRKK